MRDTDVDYRRSLLLGKSVCGVSLENDGLDGVIAVDIYLSAMVAKVKNFTDAYL